MKKQLKSIVFPVFVLTVLLLAVAGFTTDTTYMDSYIGGDADAIGNDKCIMCHRDFAPGEDATHVAALEADYEGVSCEMCHGPGGAHNGKVEGILNPTEMPEADLTVTCTQCHEEQGKFKLSEWEVSGHKAAGNTCAECHSAHVANDAYLVEAEAKDLCNNCHEDMVTAAAAGDHGGGAAVSCAMCHNPHK